MRASDAFPSKYLKSSDVKAKAKIATISSLEAEVVGQDKEEKYVLYFEGDIKPMVLNRTNWETLEDAFGDSDEWPGHKVEIYCAPTSYQGKRVDGIRLKPIVPKPPPDPKPIVPKPPLKDDLEDEVPDFGPAA